MPSIPVLCLPPSRVDPKVLGLNVLIYHSQPGGSLTTRRSPPIRWWSQCSSDDTVMVLLWIWSSKVPEKPQSERLDLFRDWQTVRDAPDCVICSVPGVHVQSASSLTSFKTELKTHLFNIAFNWLTSVRFGLSLITFIISFRMLSYVIHVIDVSGINLMNSIREIELLEAPFVCIVIHWHHCCCNIKYFCTISNDTSDNQLQNTVVENILNYFLSWIELIFLEIILM